MTDRYERSQQESGMNVINDGGPAFPVWELNGKGQPEMTGFGMTLRDYFAAKAMQTLLGSEYTSEHGLHEGWTRALAHESYMIADAMLRTREASND